MQNLDKIISNLDYRPELVNKWTQSIVNSCLEDLIKQDKPYKYVGNKIDIFNYEIFFIWLIIFLLIKVTCVIMQKNGAGLHTTSSCFWDNLTDGNFKLNLFYSSKFMLD